MTAADELRRIDELTDGSGGAVDTVMRTPIGPYWKSRLILYTPDRLKHTPNGPGLSHHHQVASSTPATRVLEAMPGAPAESTVPKGGVGGKDRAHAVGDAGGGAFTLLTVQR